MLSANSLERGKSAELSLIVGLVVEALLPSEFAEIKEGKVHHDGTADCIWQIAELITELLNR